jgi:diaminobutyrate-2-oxoglutarate transaminase
MAAGVATLRFIRDNNVVENAARMGSRFRERLALLQRNCDVIGDIRGKGLMIGLEIVDPRRTDRLGRPVGDAAAAARIQRECLDRGIILELGGRNGAVVRLLPPLIVTAAEVDTVCRALEEAIAAVAQESEAALV